jgi:hypothetical protein
VVALHQELVWLQLRGHQCASACSCVDARVTRCGLRIGTPPWQLCDA